MNNTQGKTDSNNSFNQIDEFKGVGCNNQGTVNQTINQGLKPDFYSELVEPYKETISLLKEKLTQAISPEEHQRVTTALAQAQTDLHTKEDEVIELQKLVANSKYKLVQQAMHILDTDGLTATIAFLQSPQHTMPEHQLQAHMQEFAEKYQLEASLLQLNNQYDAAKTAYECMLKYDRSAERLFTFAHFLQKQNDFQPAITYYEEALSLYRKLAQSNPTVHEPSVATTFTATKING